MSATLYDFVVPTYIQQLKNNKDFKKWEDQFRKFVLSRDRLVDRSLTYLLLYDLDDKKWVIESIDSAQFNQVAILKAVIPLKKEVDKQVEIKEYSYK